MISPGLLLMVEVALQHAEDAARAGEEWRCDCFSCHRVRQCDFDRWYCRSAFLTDVWNSEKRRPDLLLPDRSKLSKSSARRQAHRESHIRREGSGFWALTLRDSDLVEVRSGLTFQAARVQLKEWRIARMNFLLT